MNRKTKISTVTDSVVAKAQRDLEDQRATLARLETDKATAQSALEALQAGAGDVVLDDPDTAGRLAREMQELRDRIDMTDRAATAQRPRLAAAESTYLNAEADLLDKAAEPARTALKRHQDRTAELLRQLEEHEGRFAPEHLLIEEQSRNSADRFSVSWEVPKSVALDSAVVEAETPMLILREMAAGRDPQAMLNQRAGIGGRIGDRRPHEFYPACVWGPDAVVPAPAYTRTVESKTAQLAAMRGNTIPAMRQKVATLEAEIEEAKQKGDTRQLQPGPKGPAGLGGRTLVDQLALAQQKVQGLVDQESRLAEEVRALTGVEDHRAGEATAA